MSCVISRRSLKKSNSVSQKGSRPASGSVVECVMLSASRFVVADRGEAERGRRPFALGLSVSVESPAGCTSRIFLR